MVKNHIKRINTPKTWNVLRKKHKFISRPNPGRNISLSISLNTALKEMLNKTETTKESKYLIKNKKVMVNGTARFDEKFSVGFMDIVSFPEIKEYYRLVVNKKNKLVFIEINETESKVKLSKIGDKKNISKEIFQLNCSDGRNFLLKSNDKLLGEAGTDDSIVYSVPEQKPMQIIKLEKNSMVFLYKGKHTGFLVKVDEVQGNKILFKKEDKIYETKKSYALVVGKDKSIFLIQQQEDNNKNFKKTK